MIKRENLKQAIEEISRRDPAIGYSLDSLLGAGEISVPGKTDAGDGADDLLFLFKGQPVLIKKFLYFQEGTVPLEQQLLIKYGELVKKQQLQDSPEPVDYRAATDRIREAGLRLMVGHEIDYAVTRIRSELAQLIHGNDKAVDYPDAPENGSIMQSERRRRIQMLSGLISFLGSIKLDDRPLQQYLEDSGATYRSDTSITKKIQRIPRY